MLVPYFSIPMASQLKVRVQGLLEPELAKYVLDRAKEGRRPVSREVEHYIALGVAAEKAQSPVS